jgi:hypothetical protein
VKSTIAPATRQAYAIAHPKQGMEQAITWSAPMGFAFQNALLEKAKHLIFPLLTKFLIFAIIIISKI